MGVILHDSLLCRLCGKNNTNGIQLFDDETKLYILVNKHLPVTVEDNGSLPKTICPGCHLHLQDIITFHSLIDKGQKKIQALYKEELKKLWDSDCINPLLDDLNVIEVVKSEVFDETLELHDIDGEKAEPEKEVPVKKKRGRPKKSETPSEKSTPVPAEPMQRTARTRKQPVRFSETVLGKEWENVLNPEGAINDDSDKDIKKEESAKELENFNAMDIEEGIIGWVRTKTGKILGNVNAKKKVKGTGYVTRLECVVCKDIFTHTSYLLRHLQKKHIGQSDITVDDIICSTLNITTTEQDISFLGSQLSDLTGGRGKKQYVCLLCHKGYPSRSTLIYHEEKEHAHYVYACCKCEKQFKHRLVLLRHQKCHAESRSYLCEVCSLSFKHLSNLYYHKMSHNNRNRFICSLCPSTFTSKRSLEFHIRVHIGYKPHQCHICHKDFSQKNNLLEHLRVHSGEKPFKCSMCLRDFKTSSQLRMHLITHRGIRPFVCEICNKNFLHKDKFYAHIKKHTGDKPYSCSNCGKSLLEENGINEDENVLTGAKYYSCKNCNTSFSDCSNLERYMKKLQGEAQDGTITRVIYFNIDLPDQVRGEEFSNLDLGQINDENNTNSIQTLNLGISDCETEMPESHMRSKTITGIFKPLEQHDMKNKDLSLNLADIQNQLEATDHLTEAIVLKTLGSSDEEKVENQLPMFSSESMPLVLKSLEESSISRGKDMPLVLDSVTGQEDGQGESLGLSMQVQDDGLQVPQHDSTRDLSLTISSTHSEMQELKEFSGLVETTRQIVTDAQGVPIKITMSDGTQLHVTTSDGESLEVMTSDGVPIPVRLSTPSISEYIMPPTIPNIDALTVEGALRELHQLSQDYEVQFVNGSNIKLVSTTSDQNIKLLPSTPVDQSIKLLTSAADDQGIHLITSSHPSLSQGSVSDIKLLPESKHMSPSTSSHIDLLSSATTSSEIKLLTADTNDEIKLLTSSTADTSSLSPTSLKWTLHE